MKTRTHAIAAAIAIVSLTSIFAGATVAAGSASPRLPTLTLTVDRSSVTIGGIPQSGAVNVVTTVSRETHAEPTLVRLNPGVPFPAFAQAAAVINAHQGDLNYLDHYGAIVFDVSANKGTSSTQTTLQPGNYIALDLAANPNPPHADFTITQAAHPTALPTPEATITAIDFAFRGPSTLHDGELVRFQNNGFLAHQIQGIGVKNTKAAKRLTTVLLAGNDTAAQKLAISSPEFAGPLSPGGLQQETINQKPGVYVLVCIMKTQDGREHTLLGMERTIQIVK